MKISLQAIIVISLLLQGCANHTLTLSTVGPRPSGRVQRASSGALKVYTTTEEQMVGDGSPFYLHSEYTVRDQAGRFFQLVPNHFGEMDEEPQLISLPAGHYVVTGRSDNYGLVNVPVNIEPGRVTEVHLDGSFRRLGPVVEDPSLICLPNGEFVGWRSRGSLGE